MGLVRSAFKREDFNIHNQDEITFNQFLTDKYEYTNSKGVTKIGSSADKYEYTNSKGVTKIGSRTDNYEYTNSKGVTKIGSRTARTSITEKFDEFEENLYLKQHAYLLHRYECKNDIYHWLLIKENGLVICISYGLF